MLRRIDLKNPWRSLSADFWSDDHPLGIRSVVYGHNGSGKSTVSELLLSLAEGDSATSVVWQDEQKHRTSIAKGGKSPSASMAVYTRKWVEENLSAFLDGAGASAIVTLGREAIDAKEEETRLVGEIGELRRVAGEATTQQKTADQKVEKCAREVQDRIVSELKAFDYQHFTRNRYSVTKVQEDLRNYRGDFPDSGAHTEALKRLGEATPSPVPDVATAPTSITKELGQLDEVLTETPTRIAIEALDGDANAQAWVEQGLALHDGSDRCLFCAEEISDNRRQQLARHFDESWLQIRGNAQALKVSVAEQKRSLVEWFESLPAATSLSPELQAVYSGAYDKAKVNVDEHLAALAAIEQVLSKKSDDPSSTPDAPERSVLDEAPSTTVLVQAVAEHNAQVAHHADATKERTQTVLHHLVGSQSNTFRSLEQAATELKDKSKVAHAAAELAERRLDEVRQAQFTTKDMADTLTNDLARVYGKNHLTVVVTSDGKSYACRRGNEPGTNLSHGEQTTLSLLYFLRKLEDEQVLGDDKSQRIVVIDDPSSSLDREALFATHQWLFDTLDGFGQYIIFTHDFSMLRLFVQSHKTAWRKSAKRIKDGEPDEIRFPKVSFLEMYAASIDGERRSRVGKLPQVLLKNTSEYAYLFSTLMTGIADTQDNERLFLLPNAARRVLEIFASYKAPHRTDFIQQLAVLVETESGEPYRDVYDFCNRFSHGEGSESIDVLDARAVHSQIRRCMEFLREVDGEHFERMCKATDIEPSSLS